MLAVVSHDAGGAEVVSSYVRRQRIQARFVLAGPAQAIFKRKLGPIEIVSLDEALIDCTSVLCGTSWQSDLELSAIRGARALAKPSVAFLDHWVNYRERFVRSGETYCPDEIWVGDTIAKTRAEKEFANLPVRLFSNPYLEDIRAEYAAIDVYGRTAPRRISVLYACEPTREHALARYGDGSYFGYTEEEAMRYFLSGVRALEKPIERIRIRPHPSEAADKYAWVPVEFQLPIEMGGSESLVREIASCDVVVGCESMALVVGLICGKRVISCIPPGGRPCGLPQLEIEHLYKLLASSEAIDLESSIPRSSLSPKRSAGPHT